MAKPIQPFQVAILSVPDVAGLKAIVTSSLQVGARVYVACFDQWFKLTAAALTFDNVTTVKPTVGPNGWERVCVPTSQWLQQAAWFVDATGSDTNSGLTALLPLATWGELRRRVCSGDVWDLTVAANSPTVMVGAGGAPVDPLVLEVLSNTELLSLVGTPGLGAVQTIVAPLAAPSPATNANGVFHPLPPANSILFFPNGAGGGFGTAFAFGSAQQVPGPPMGGVNAADPWYLLGDQYNVLTLQQISVIKMTGRTNNGGQHAILATGLQFNGPSGGADGFGMPEDVPIQGVDFLGCLLQAGACDVTLSGSLALGSTTLNLSGACAAFGACLGQLTIAGQTLANTNSIVDTVEILPGGRLTCNQVGCSLATSLTVDGQGLFVMQAANDLYGTGGVHLQPQSAVQGGAHCTISTASSLSWTSAPTQQAIPTISTAALAAGLKNCTNWGTALGGLNEATFTGRAFQPSTFANVVPLWPPPAFASPRSRPRCCMSPQPAATPRAMGASTLPGRASSTRWRRSPPGARASRPGSGEPSWSRRALGAGPTPSPRRTRCASPTPRTGRPKRRPRPRTVLA